MESLEIKIKIEEFKLKKLKKNNKTENSGDGFSCRREDCWALKYISEDFSGKTVFVVLVFVWPIK